MERDQHFLNNDEILERIVDALNLKDSDEILEIGPGFGSLTRTLLEREQGKIHAVEKDEKFIRVLELLDKEYENFSFTLGDALEELPNSYFTKVIGNIPYSLTEPLYTKFLELRVSYVVLLQGKSFYDIIQSEESKWSFFVKSMYDVECLEIVSGEEFEPKTKVESVVLKLKIKEKFSRQDLFFQKLFEKRKRSVENAILFTLVDLSAIPKKEAQKKVDELDLDKELKEKVLERLSNEEWKRVISQIKLD
jgi:16S rRNA (adenine1518-N6/adenine1519-N6)-dimethyltransferase